MTPQLPPVVWLAGAAVALLLSLLAFALLRPLPLAALLVKATQSPRAGHAGP